MNYFMTLLTSALGLAGLGTPEGELPVLTPEAFIEAIEGVKHLDKQRTYYVYCRSGKRSNAAATYLLGQGFRVRDMQGGYLRWTAEGRPVVK